MVGGIESEDKVNDFESMEIVVGVGAVTRSGEPLWPDKPGVRWRERIGGGRDSLFPPPSPY